jgi:hypothetical protein
MLARSVLAGLAAWCLALTHHLWLAPELLRIPADYVSEAHISATTQFRDSADSAWTTSSLIARRVDQLLVSSASHAIIQGDLHWTNAAGVVQFESSAIYGVDRYTRHNIAGYGNEVRNGPFLFPRHTEKKKYLYWDTQFIGQCEARFVRSVVIGGTELYEFHFTASKLDETEGYAHLPDVPERYRVQTDGHGTLWIEPASGTIVDYQEQGVSYLVTPGGGERVGEVYIWKGQFTGPTKARRLSAALTERHRSIVLERVIPLVLLIIGLLLIGIGLWRTAAARRQTRHGSRSPAPVVVA